MSAQTEMLNVYLVNVWRLLFSCTRTPGSSAWTAIDNESFYHRIFDMGVEIGRDLDVDLTSAQAACDAGLKYRDWIEGQRREPTSA